MLQVRCRFVTTCAFLRVQPRSRDCLLTCTLHARSDPKFTFIQRRIFIFSFGGVDKYLGGAAACFGRGVVATPGKAKEKV